MEVTSATEQGSRSTRVRIVGAVAAGLTVAFATVILVTGSWHDQLVAEQRLLPGTVVAGTDVGGAPIDEVHAVAQAAADAGLDRPVTLTDGSDEQQVRPRALDATTDADEVVAAALDATATASWAERLRIRWLGGNSSFKADVAVNVPQEASVALADQLGEDIDRDPRDATVEWSSEGLRLQEHRIGRRLDRDTTASDVRNALEGGADRVDLPVEDLAPAVSTDMVENVYPAVEESVDAALDRTVTVTYDDATWEISPRDLGASPDVEGALEIALAEPGDGEAAGAEAAAISDGGSSASLDVSLSVPEEVIADRLEGMAEHIDRSPRDAAVDYSSGWVNLVEEQPGRAVDRDTALEQLEDALVNGGDEIELPVDRVDPGVTTDAYRHVLLVRQDSRRLHLYVDGEITREWPIAVGTTEDPTPTGEFTIGAKRRGPTWHNPSPNGWGADMPRVIGPGPDNPLGVRALNWNRGDHDTLIRFHGTSRTNSIGQAASQGCVRLTNSDVVELYDLVPSGATVISLRA